MNLSLGPIQIFVSDIEKAEKWYTKILGMKLIEKYPEIKCLHMKLGKAKFYIETPCKEWGEGYDKVKIGGRTPIIFYAKNIEKTVFKMKKAGVKFVEEISMRPWGELKAVFCDNDANEFNLIQK